MPMISVIVPVFKVEPYLHQCVDSILNQTYQDFELILVDDGSPDNCPTICDEYAKKDKRVIVIHKSNGGLSSARNAGLNYVFTNSKSEYISFVDSDDWVDSRYLELLLNSMVNDYADVAMTGVATTLKDGKEMLNYCFFNSEIISSEILFEKCANGYNGWLYTIVCAKMYKASLLDTIRFRPRTHEDEFFSNELYSHNNVVIKTISDCLYFYRRDNSNSITQRYTFYSYRDSFLAALERYTILKRNKYDFFNYPLDWCFSSLSRMHKLKRKGEYNVFYKCVFLFMFKIKNNFNGIKMKLNVIKLLLRRYK